MRGYTESVDELEIKGIRYISSKRASVLTGYAKDYIGQLVRSGKISGTRVGRSWYVSEKDLLGHSNALQSISEPAVEAPKKILSPIQRKPLSPSTLKAYPHLAKTLPDTWSPVRYYYDDAELLPVPQKETLSPFLELQEETKSREAEIGTKIRIKVLEGRLASKPLPAPSALSKVTPIEKAKIIREQKHKKSLTPILVSLGAVAASLGVLLFFASGFFFSSNIDISSGSGAMTANTLMGVEYAKDVLRQYPVLLVGWNDLLGFFNLLSASFWGFFEKGLSFLQNLPNLIR